MNPPGVAEERIMTALAGAARGPRRNGIFAIWLFTRVASGMLPPDPLSVRTQKRRLEALGRRFSSLSMPPPLRRALASGLKQLTDGSPREVALALRQLVAPARETMGGEVADALTLAARQARAAVTGEGGA